MSSRDTKVKQTLLVSGIGLLVKEYQKNLSYGHTGMQGMVHWALRALRTIIGLSDKLVSVFVFVSFVARRDHFSSKSLKNSSKEMFPFNFQLLGHI